MAQAPNHGTRALYWSQSRQHSGGQRQPQSRPSRPRDPPQAKSRDENHRRQGASPRQKQQLELKTKLAERQGDGFEELLGQHQTERNTEILCSALTCKLLTANASAVMSLDLTSSGYETKVAHYTYDWKAPVLYALGIGAKRSELSYLYEGRGPQVFPSFAVVPVLPVVGDLLARTGGDLSMVVHGGQTIELHRPIPPEGTLETVGKVEGIYDMKKMAQVVLRTQTRVDGEACFDTEWSIIFRGAGGQGERPPQRPKPPSIPDGSTPDWVHEEATSEEQALLYRLSGDLNPLHADPEFAEQVGFPQGPILHGLCTYGYVVRAVVRHACKGDASQLVRLSAQFRKPVWPGDKIRTEGYHLENGVVALRAFVVGRPDPILANCAATLGA